MNELEMLLNLDCFAHCQWLQKVDELPKDKGSYALLLYLTQDKTITVGKKGAFDLQAGYYIYVGSAMGSGGLASRVGRHWQMGDNNDDNQNLNKKQTLENKPTFDNSKFKVKSKPKAKHWHIDYLRSEMTLLGAWVLVDNAIRHECAFAQALQRLSIQNLALSFKVLKLGSSDCTCQGHVFFIDKLN